MKLSATVFILALLWAGPSHAQSFKEIGKAAKTVELANKIAAGNYRFVAQTILPMAAQARQLDGDMYDLTIRKDSIVCYLPYFGRAYSAPNDPTDIGLKFTSLWFTYTAQNPKSGEWDVEIVPKDARDYQKLLLTIFDNGNASLKVLTSSRQPVSFEGYIR